MSGDRRWMYNRMKNGYLTDEFVEGLETFVDFACNQVEWMDEDKIRCPCKHRKCQNRNFLQPDEVKYHLARYGFVPDYYIWDRHGEIHVEVDNSNMHCRERAQAQPTVDYHTMVRDAADHELEPMLGPSDVEESPNPDSKRFYDMLNATDKELWPGCSKHSQLPLESVNSNDPSFTADSNLDEAESNKRIDEHYIAAVGGIGKKRRGIGSCGIISQLDELRQRFQTFEERFEMMMSRLSTSQSGGEIKLNDS